MNTIDRLIIEVSSAPNNALLASWLTVLLVDERDMNPTEAARHVAQVQQLGRDSAELLAATRPSVQSCRTIKKRSR